MKRPNKTPEPNRDLSRRDSSLTLGRMKKVLSVIFVVFSAALTSGAEGSAPVAIASEQSEFLPREGVRYEIIGRRLYRSDDPSNPGPASVITSHAWSEANEFVYRTALRKKCRLPAGSTGWENGRFRVTYRVDDNREVLSVFVFLGERPTVEFAYRKKG
jgi:hypothetical protein